MTNDYSELLNTSLDDERFVRRMFAQIEADLRTLALVSLTDWDQAGLSDPDGLLFESLVNLKAPSMGSWRYLLETLSDAQNQLSIDADAVTRQRLEQATTLSHIMMALERRLEPEERDKLQTLRALRGNQSKKPTVLQVLVLVIELRNRAQHDHWSDATLWAEVANALRLLADWLSQYNVLPHLPEDTRFPAPFYVQHEGEWWVFNGIKEREAIYINAGGRDRRSQSDGISVLELIERLLGKTTQRDNNFYRWLNQLAPEDVKGVLLGDYRVGPPVGKGSFATVHKGLQLSTGRQVAIKILRDGQSEEIRTRFQQEAEFLGRLNHPHIIHVLGYGEDRWSAPRDYSLKGEQWYDELFGSNNAKKIKTYLALEWVQGHTLEDYYQKRIKPNLDVTTKLRWFLAAAEALDYVHTNDLIHRDIKPANLMVTETGVLKLMDFGVARNQVRRSAMATAVGQSVGTLAYMAPEQIRAEEAARKVGPRADIYGLCQTFFELFTHTRLFNHENTDAQTLSDIKCDKNKAGKPPHPRKLNKALPQELDVILMGGLEYEAADRYDSAKALARDLRHVLNNEPIEYRRPSFWRRMQLFYRRNRLLVNIALFLVPLILLLIILFLWQWLQTEMNRTELLRQQGASAVVRLVDGDVPGGVAMLDMVLAQDRWRRFPEYKTLLNAWRAQLQPLDQVLADLSKPGLFRWRGRDYFHRGLDHVQLLPDWPLLMAGIIASGRLITLHEPDPDRMILNLWGVLPKEKTIRLDLGEPLVDIELLEPPTDDLLLLLGRRSSLTIGGMDPVWKVIDLAKKQVINSSESESFESGFYSNKECSEILRVLNGKLEKSRFDNQSDWQAVNWLPVEKVDTDGRCQSIINQCWNSWGWMSDACINQVDNCFFSQNNSQVPSFIVFKGRHISGYWTNAILEHGSKSNPTQLWKGIAAGIEHPCVKHQVQSPLYLSDSDFYDPNDNSDEYLLSLP